MFQWIKREGCNCCPTPEGTERYSLHVGRLFRGEVEFDGEVWSAELFVVDGKHPVTGQSGGTATRDDCMKLIENDISDCISSFMSVISDPSRKIFAALVSFDEQGNTVRQELP